LKWFKHDSDANTDAKLKRVRQKYGFTGYGLYWYCLELIAGNVSKKNITFELEEDAEIIALDWNCDQLKVQEMMEYMCGIGLFSTNNGVIQCLKLAKRLDDTNSKNPQIKSIIDQLSSKQSELVGVNRSESEKVPLDRIRLDKNKTKEGKTCRYADLAIQILESWKKHLPNNPQPIAKNFSSSSNYKTLITRIKSDEQHQTIEFWDWYFSKLAENPFNLGHNDRGWKANFDYAITKSKFENNIERFASE